MKCDIKDFVRQKRMSKYYIYTVNKLPGFLDAQNANLHDMFAESRMVEMTSMGIGNKPCLDLKPNVDSISDRSINVSNISNRGRQIFILLHYLLDAFF
jgi:hypothetical protein